MPDDDVIKSLLDDLRPYVTEDDRELPTEEFRLTVADRIYDDIANLVAEDEDDDAEDDLTSGDDYNEGA